MFKTYQSLQNFKLSTSVTVDGKQESIDFIGGILRPFKKNGKFTTDNPKLQKAIENDSGYGKQFILISQEQPSKDSKKITEPEKDETFEPISDDSKSVQQAKKFLIDKYPDKVKISTLTNRNKVVEAGARLNVTFPNLLQA
jgi:hypothetical protein